jgi:hypothetical protein
MRWFYLSEIQESIPTTDTQLPELAQQGILRPTTQMWRTGMAGWASASELHPALFASHPPVARKQAQQQFRGLLGKAVWGVIAGVAGMVATSFAAVYQMWYAFSLLRVRGSEELLGDEVKLAMERNFGADMRLPVFFIVLRALLWIVVCVCLALAALWVCQGSASLRAGQLHGQTWLLDKGATGLGNGLFWLGLGSAILVGGIAVLGLATMFSS